MRVSNRGGWAVRDGKLLFPERTLTAPLLLVRLYPSQRRQRQPAAGRRATKALWRPPPTTIVIAFLNI